MKKRVSKLTALVLSLALTLSLSLPAATAWGSSDILQTTQGASLYLSWYEFLFQYAQEHPEYYADFDADAWFAEEYFWEDKETFMGYMGLEDEAAFKEYLWDEYLAAVSAEPNSPLFQEADAAYSTYLIETYESRHPGELDQLSTKELLSRSGYTKTLTPIEQYMKDWGLSEDEVRPALLREYAANRFQVETDIANALIYQQAYPEQWASFDADAWFAEQYSWWDKAEYMALYGLLTEEEFQANMFVHYVEDQYWSWDFPWIGDKPSAISLIVNGEDVETAVTMADGRACTDAATLNRILGTSLTGEQIPIRQAAEAAGWDVVWNDFCDEVILFRSSDLPQMDFSRFDELMNRLLSAAKTEKGQSYKTTETTTLKLTAFNSLDGDQTFSARVTTELLQKDALYELTVTVSAADLMRLVPQASLNLLDAQFVSDLSGLLRTCKATALLNAETGDLYLNAPVLSLLDSDFAADTWLHWNAGFSLEDSGLAGMLLRSRDGWNTGALLYQALLDDSANNYWGGWYAYTNSLQTWAALGVLAAPQNFTERGRTLTWTLTPQSLQLLLPEEDETLPSLTDLFKEYAVKLSVDKNGKITADAVLRPDMDALASLFSQESWDPNPASTALIAWVTSLFDFRMESHASGTADKSSGAASFHWKNQFKLETSSTTTRQKTGAAPRSAPPSGAEILDFS